MFKPISEIDFEQVRADSRFHSIKEELQKNEPKNETKMVRGFFLEVLTQADFGNQLERERSCSDSRGVMRNIKMETQSNYNKKMLSSVMKKEVYDLFESRKGEIRCCRRAAATKRPLQNRDLLKCALQDET